MKQCGVKFKESPGTIYFIDLRHEHQIGSIRGRGSVAGSSPGEKLPRDSYLQCQVIAELPPCKNHPQLVSWNSLSLGNCLFQLEDAGIWTNLHGEAMAGVEPDKHWTRAKDVFKQGFLMTYLY